MIIRDEEQYGRVRPPPERCPPTARREPTRAELEAALGNEQEVFAYGMTVRRCLDCSAPVPGGPTRCDGCVAQLTTA